MSTARRALAPLHVPRAPRVLVVDDLEPNRLALIAMLAPLGFEMVSASSGREALRLLLREDFALVLLDVQMPGMDGFETARHVRSVERTKHLPIIFVTALDAERAPAFRGYREGAVDYLTKPLDADILRSKVRVFAELYRRGETIREQDAHLARERADAWRDELLSIVAHELRTPLNAISSWVQLLRDGGLDDAQERRALETIDRNVKVQARLIADVLEVSRLAQGSVSLSIAPFDVLASAAGAIEVARAATTKAIELSLHDDGLVDPCVADEARVRQVLDRLLENALRHTHEGGHIEVRLRGKGGGLAAWVRDDGEGLEPARLAEIFEPLGKTSHRPSAVRGLGLGLPIARSLCELHGGALVAESEGPGRGATFSFWLPRPH